MALDLKNINLKNLDPKNVYEWPIYGRVLIFFLVCVGVFYLGYFFDFSTFSGQIFSRMQQEVDLKSQVKSILKTEEDMKEVVSQYPEVVTLLNQWQGQLISGGNLPDLLNKILKLGADNHLQFSQFAPGAKKLKDDYYRVPIKVVARGDYSQIANFVSQVANLPQLVAVSDFILQKQAPVESSEEKLGAPVNAANTNITAGLTLEVYYLVNKK